MVGSRNRHCQVTTCRQSEAAKPDCWPSAVLRVDCSQCQQDQRVTSQPTGSIFQAAECGIHIQKVAYFVALEIRYYFETATQPYSGRLLHD